MQAFVGQFRVRDLLAVDRGDDARHLGAKLRVVPNVLHGRGILQLLEEFAGDIAQLAFVDAFGQLVCTDFQRNITSRNLCLRT